MKIKTNQVLKNVKGEIIKENEIPVTLGMIISAALLNEEKSKDPERSYRIATESQQKDEVNFTVEDVTFIKERIRGASLPVLLTGQALTLFDA